MHESRSLSKDCGTHSGTDVPSLHDAWCAHGANVAYPVSPHRYNGQSRDASSCVCEREVARWLVWTLVGSGCESMLGVRDG
jgi:hypothetical protein